MHPGINGPKLKDKPAIIMAGSGDVITHQQLNELSNQGAQLLDLWVLSLEIAWLL